MIQRDKAATAKARFEDERSFVTKDGRHILRGLDWKARKLELWKRCGGKCEAGEQFVVAWKEKILAEGKMVRCENEAVDPHHLVKRSELRDDRLGNLQALCRHHHDLLDERKPRFGERKNNYAKA